MKFLISLSVLLVAPSLWACPNMSGTWACSDSDGTRARNIVTQEPMANGVLYRMTDASDGSVAEYRADGIERSYQEQGIKGTITVKCLDDKTVTGLRQFDGESVKGRIEFQYTLQNPQTISGLTKTSLSFMGSAPRDSEIQSTCIRQ